MARIFFIVFIFSGLYAQCSEMDEMECGNDNNCERVEDIEIINCSTLPTYGWGVGSCDYYYPDCYEYLDYGGSYGSWSTECGGGTVQIDNSYCEEIQMPEPPVCSDIDTQEECDHPFHGDGCTWIPDIEYDACQSLNQSNCNTTNGCDWEVDIQYGSCSNLGSSSCDATPGCWGAYTNPGWYYGWYCAGGTYVISDNSSCSGDIDNGYCTEAYELGDVNLDGYLNVIDIVELVTIILNAEYSISGDVNQDGINNITDIISLINVVLGSE